MATATATMDDLVASLGGSMHVSSDLKALQDYLAQNMIRPSIPLPLASPNVFARPIPPSRSTSSTRQPTSLPSSYTYPHDINQTYPSPIAQTSFSAFQEEGEGGPGPSTSERMMMSTPTGMTRPGGPLRRTSSYGFGCSLQVAPSSPPTTWSNFDSDAFAPMWQQHLEHQKQQQQQVNDPWAKIRSQQSNAFSGQVSGSGSGYNVQNPFSGSGQTSAFGGAFRPPQGFGLSAGGNGLGQMGGSPPTPPAEDDDEMDEDCIDAEMDEMEDDEEDDRIERPMGFVIANDSNQYTDSDGWDRGRGKEIVNHGTRYW
ncbi:uncharacterized protein I303_104298 [Kwoniella dejecticola CBS 10117]|uniref:Uncharacterized protein n=1 Tax=Kwoniella dejecticola CBS 10117 TaxID=1296121 RepID=A0A1A6A5Q6_9TREE|nr:uncharacterized protein I303_04727 [Kwoniella dejecticola CBS 10117]OBR85392.1 hypothetical protein I303_04727 [Kwoniella dejecticola CBS 10117]